MIEKNDARQRPVAAFVDFTYADLESGVSLDAVEVPPGAVVVGGFLQITEAFNTGSPDGGTTPGTDVLTVGDADSDNRYADAVDGQAVGITELTIDGREYPQLDNVTLKWTSTGVAPSAGAGRLVVEYIATGRAEFTQG